MTLVTSGTLYLGPTISTDRNIRAEILGSVGSYELITASNAAGKTLPTGMLEFYGYTSLIVPLPPGNPDAAQTNIDCVPLDWLCTWNSSAGADTYRLEYDIDGGTRILISSTITTTSRTGSISGLVNFQEITFYVRAQNAAGDSAYSAAISFFAECGTNGK